MEDKIVKLTEALWEVWNYLDAYLAIQMIYEKLLWKLLSLIKIKGGIENEEFE